MGRKQTLGRSLLCSPERQFVIDWVKTRFIVEGNGEPLAWKVAAQLHLVDVLEHSTQITKLAFGRLNVAMNVRYVDVVHHCFDRNPITICLILETTQ